MLTSCILNGLLISNLRICCCALLAFLYASCSRTIVGRFRQLIIYLIKCFIYVVINKSHWKDKIVLKYWSIAVLHHIRILIWKKSVMFMWVIKSASSRRRTCIKVIIRSVGWISSNTRLPMIGIIKTLISISFIGILFLLLFPSINIKMIWIYFLRYYIAISKTVISFL